MGIDLSGVVGERLEKALKLARRLQAEGDLKQAGAMYSRAAKLMAEHAGHARSKEVKEKRQADAENLRNVAEQLRQGKVPGAEAKVPAGSAGGAGDAEVAEEMAPSGQVVPDVGIGAVDGDAQKHQPAEQEEEAQVQRGFVQGDGVNGCAAQPCCPRCLGKRVVVADGQRRLGGAAEAATEGDTANATYSVAESTRQYGHVEEQQQ